MALVKCPECGRENVSDTAEACPNCGYAIKNHYQRVREEEAKQARLKAENEKRILEERQKSNYRRTTSERALQNWKCR